jgi:hypothetical protein
VLTDFGMRVAASTYYAAITRPPSARAVRDEELKKEIKRVYEENYSVYGVEKVWWVLNREGIVVRGVPGGTADARGGPSRRGAGQKGAHDGA